ncbi:hypothetical protein Hanom_Chr10g00883121 [Helianthus anomalus]
MDQRDSWFLIIIWRTSYPSILFFSLIDHSFHQESILGAKRETLLIKDHTNTEEASKAPMVFASCD